MMRILGAIRFWALLLLVLVALFFLATPEAWRPRVLNIATLAGTLLLAVPAIRLNEQGRLIDNVRTLQAGVVAIGKSLEQGKLSDDVRRRQQADLDKRRSDLESNLNDLTAGKGAWTSWVHHLLYTGYVLILAAALARAFG